MNKIQALVADSPRYTLHSHTQFCDGRATMAEFAAAAVDAGFTAYGFSPHSPVPIESPCNMSLTDVPLYLDEAMRLRLLYRDRIKIFTSMEIDYLGSDWGPANKYFQTLPLDYRIGSVHFISSKSGDLVDVDGRFENFRRKMAENFNSDIRYVVDSFYDRSEAMILAGGFDIIGHFDKIGHNASHYAPGIEHEPWYKQRIDRIIRLIKDSGITVEINTKSWDDHHRMFPSVDIIPHLKSAEIPMIVNSDAHYTDKIDAARQVALDIIKS